MSTLLLRLASPLQSWGSDSKFDRRNTQREPTKSGVIGLLAAALGRRREETLDDISELKFGVRIDQPGKIIKDFHTARDINKKNPYVTERYYLADAVFLVGIEGEKSFIEILEKAILAPVFPLFLGRRSCPPDGRISLGIKNMDLENALREEPWQAGEWYKNRYMKKGTPISLTLVLDSPQVTLNRRRDLPISFNQKYRQHKYRYIDDIPDTVPVGKIHAAPATEHDAFKEI